MVNNLVDTLYWVYHILDILVGKRRVRREIDWRVLNEWDFSRNVIGFQLSDWINFLNHDFAVYSLLLCDFFTILFFVDFNKGIQEFWEISLLFGAIYDLLDFGWQWMCLVLWLELWIVNGATVLINKLFGRFTRCWCEVICVCASVVCSISWWYDLWKLNCLNLHLLIYLFVRVQNLSSELLG